MPKRPARPIPKLYIGEWIEALGLDQKKIAMDAEISESYLSNLINPDPEEPKNPTIAVVYYIAAAMGLEVTQLMRPPPTRGLIEEITRLPPSLIDRLRKP